MPNLSRCAQLVLSILVGLSAVMALGLTLGEHQTDRTVVYIDQGPVTSGVVDDTEWFTPDDSRESIPNVSPTPVPVEYFHLVPPSAEHRYGGYEGLAISFDIGPDGNVWTTLDSVVRGDDTQSLLSDIDRDTIIARLIDLIREQDGRGVDPVYWKDRFAVLIPAN